MIWILKISGMLLLLVSCTAAGCFKAYCLTRRADRLNEIYGCLEELGQRIRYDGGERSRLLETTFGGREILSHSDTQVTVLDCGISGDDKSILDDFFSRLGSGGGETEYDRVQLYLSLIAKQRAEADKNASELSKLYRTVGFCAGIFGCIFFL